MPKKWIFVFVVSLVLLAGCDRGDGDSSEKSDESAASTSSEAEKSTSESRDAQDTGEPASTDGSSAREGTPSPSGASARLPEGTARQRRLLKEAKTAFMQGRLEQAKPKFEKVVETGELSGTQVSAYIALGQIYIESDEPAKAVELIESMPDSEHDVVEVRLIEARAHSAQENLERAAATYEEIVELQPNYLFAYPPLGEIYTKMGKEKKAAETYHAYENKLTTLARRIENPDETKPVERINALDLFSAANDERAYKAVRAALDDPVPRVKAKAAITAGQLGLEDARVDLEAMVENADNRRVKQAAAQALRQLDSKRADQ